MSHAKDVKVKRIVVELDKPRTIKFDLNAFVELEEMYGSFEQAMKELEKGSIKAVRALLWAGLLHEEPTLTLQKVGTMVDLPTLNKITEALTAAIEDALPESSSDEVKGDVSGNPQ